MEEKVVKFVEVTKVEIAATNRWWKLKFYYLRVTRRVFAACIQILQYRSPQTPSPYSRIDYETPDPLADEATLIPWPHGIYRLDPMPPQLWLRHFQFQLTAYRPAQWDTF